MLMTLSQAQAISEAHARDLDSYHECLADTGSSAFYGGAQGNGGYDAMQIAREVLGAPPEVTPEIAEAEVVCRMFSDLRVYSRNELAGLTYLTRVPEFGPKADTIPF